MSRKQSDQDLRALAKRLASDINESTLRLGNVLVAIHDTQMFFKWGYNTWEDYLKEEVAMSHATAWRTMAISKWATTMGLTVKQRERLARLGRFKALYVSQLCKTRKKIDHYIKIAEQNSIKFLQAEITGRSPDHIPRNWSVQLLGAQRQSLEQALDLAIDISDEFATRGDLLNHICEDYIKRHTKSRKGKTAMR